MARKLSTAEKQELATAAEALAAVKLEKRGHAPIKSRGGKARTLNVVNAEGEVVGLATHGEVLAGAAKKAEIDIAVQDGQRPTMVMCRVCKRPVTVGSNGRGGGAVPKYCVACRSRVSAARLCQKNQRERRARIGKLTCAYCGVDIDVPQKGIVPKGCPTCSMRLANKLLDRPTNAVCICCDNQFLVPKIGRVPLRCESCRPYRSRAVRPPTGACVDCQVVFDVPVIRGRVAKRCDACTEFHRQQKCRRAATRSNAKKKAEREAAKKADRT